jgi:hypothetical protein
MSDLERLHEIINTLPPRQVHALLALLEPAHPIEEGEFARRLAAAPEEDADQETVERVLAAEAEQGDAVSHDEMKLLLEL